jgi:hypothetical protein
VSSEPVLFAGLLTFMLGMALLGRDPGFATEPTRPRRSKRLLCTSVGLAPGRDRMCTRRQVPALVTDRLVKGATQRAEGRRRRAATARSAVSRVKGGSFTRYARLSTMAWRSTDGETHRSKCDVRRQCGKSGSPLCSQHSSLVLR